MSSSNIGPAQINKATDLNHLLLIVHKPDADEVPWVHALNEFISENGRESRVRRHVDFNYDAFRNALLGDTGIATNATLYTRSQFDNIADPPTFCTCLAKVQTDSTVPIHGLYRLPYLELWTTDAPAQAQRRRHAPPKEPQVSTSNPENSDRAPTGRPLDHPVDDPVEPEIDPEDPDPDKSGSTEQEYDDGHSLLDIVAPSVDADDDNWKQVCKFFNCGERDERIVVLGISLPLLPYQAYCVWRVFKQFATDNIRSFMIGDAPGLGKTGTSFTIAVIFAMLKSTYREVRREWRTNKPRNHLSATQKGDNIKCPTQGRRILCPCVQKGLSYDIIRALDDFPTIVCSDPKLIKQWVEEAEKWIDRSGYSPSSGIKVFAHHRDLAQLTEENVKDIEGRLPQRIEEGSKIEERLGSSSDIIIVSSKGTRQLDYIFKKVLPADDDTWGSTLGTSLMFFDEYHNYKGTRTTLTHPFQLLYQIKQRLRVSPMAIGLSASLRQGPEFFIPFVDYAFKSADGQYAEIAGLKPGDLERCCTDFTYLVNNLGRSDMTARQKTERDRRQQAVFSFFGKLVPQMLLARKRGTMFRGKRIAAPDTVIESIQQDMPAGETRQSFEETSARVKSYFTTRFDEELKRWEAEGRQGGRPDKVDFYNQVVDSISNNPGRNREWEILTKALCFPHIAHLYSQDRVISRDQLLVAEINKLATPISRLLHPLQRQADQVERIDEYLAQSPFYEYRDILRDRSPKIVWVEGKINELLRLALLSPGSPEAMKYGPSPPDGTNVRHALVFTQAPASAFIIFMILWNTFGAQIRDNRLSIQYAHSGISHKSRGEIAAYMQEDCQGQGPVKVLVSTMDTFGEGYNLQRINTVIITEVGNSYEKQRQAFGRVDRTGQTMRPYLYQLYDGKNLCERVRMLRSGNRKRIAEKGQDEKNPDAGGIVDIFDV